MAVLPALLGVAISSSLGTSSGATVVLHERAYYGGHVTQDYNTALNRGGLGDVAANRVCSLA